MKSLIEIPIIIFHALIDPIKPSTPFLIIFSKQSQSNIRKLLQNNRIIDFPFIINCTVKITLRHEIKLVEFDDPRIDFLFHFIQSLAFFTTDNLFFIQDIEVIGMTKIRDIDIKTDPAFSTVNNDRGLFRVAAFRAIFPIKFTTSKFLDRS